jgi:hypothetical protein
MNRLMCFVTGSLLMASALNAQAQDTKQKTTTAPVNHSPIAARTSITCLAFNRSPRESTTRALFPARVEARADMSGHSGFIVRDTLAEAR